MLRPLNILILFSFIILPTLSFSGCGNAIEDASKAKQVLFNPTPSPTVAPEVAKANEIAAGLINKIFRKYNDNTYFAKWNYRDVFNYDAKCAGTVLIELVNFKWNFYYHTPSDTDKRNGVEWNGAFEITWDDTRSFVISGAESCFTKSGRTEYKGNYSALAKFSIEKRVGESVKLLEATGVDSRHPFFGTAKAPSLEEINRARSLPLNKELPSWF